MEKSNEFTHVRLKISKRNFETDKVTSHETNMSIKDWNMLKKTAIPKSIKYEVIEKFSQNKALDAAAYDRLRSDYENMKEHGSAVDILKTLESMQLIKKEGWVSNAITSYQKKAEKELESIAKAEKVKELIAEATRFESESNIKKALEAYTEAKVLDPENELLTVRIASLKANNQG